jgi:hypothetical protein
MRWLEHKMKRGNGELLYGKENLLGENNVKEL